MNFIKELFFLGLLILTITSCKEKDDICPTINCNKGVQDEKNCDCNCPEGYLGTNCETLDITKVQVLLDDNITPIELFNSSVPLKDLYGKIYQGGQIAYLNTDDGTGIVSAMMDASTTLNWFDAISYCDELTSEGNSDWYLPDINELNFMWLNLADSDGDVTNLGLSDSNNLGSFLAEPYWSAREEGSLDAWDSEFNDGDQEYEDKNLEKNVRAVRAF